MRHLRNGWRTTRPRADEPSGFRVYRTPADRRRAIAQLRRRGYNYFTEYPDVAGPALSFACVVDAPTPEHPYRTATVRPSSTRAA